MSIKLRTTKISSQGQVTLPKSFIELSGLVNGQLVDLEITKKGILIKKRQKKMSKYIGILKDKLDITTEQYLKIRKEEAKL
jgi:bifunctional DNA-binding transcriptional regulator/antitoxin component of YhaV-PrlF toxin-antitoxin module